MVDLVVRCPRRNARPIADDIARRTKVKITGIDSVTSAAEGRIQEQFPNPLDALPYQ